MNLKALIDEQIFYMSSNLFVSYKEALLNSGGFSDQNFHKSAVIISNVDLVNKFFFFKLKTIN